MKMKTKLISNFSGGLNTKLNQRDIEDNELSDMLNLMVVDGNIKPRFGTSLINNELLDGTIYTWIRYQNFIYIHCKRDDTNNGIEVYNIKDKTHSTVAIFKHTEIAGKFFINDVVYLKLGIDSTTGLPSEGINVYSTSRIPIIANRIVSDENGISKFVQFEYLNSMTNSYKARYDVSRGEDTDKPIKLALMYPYKKYEGLTDSSGNTFNPKQHIQVGIIDIASGEYSNISDTDYDFSNSYIYNSVTGQYSYVSFVTINNESIKDGYDVIQIQAESQVDEFEDDSDKNTTIQNCDIAEVYNNSIVFASSFDSTHPSYVYFSEPLQENYFPQNPEFNRIIGGNSSNIKGFSKMSDDLLVFTEYEIYGISSIIMSDGTTSYKVYEIDSNIGLSNMYTIQQYGNNTLFMYNKNLYMTLRYNTTGTIGVAKIDDKVEKYMKKSINSSEQPIGSVVNNFYYLSTYSGYIFVLNLDNIPYMYKENMYYMNKQLNWSELRIPKAKMFIDANINSTVGKMWIATSISSSPVQTEDSVSTDYTGDNFDYYFETKAWDFGDYSKFKYIESIDILLDTPIVTVENQRYIFLINESTSISNEFKPIDIDRQMGHPQHIVCHFRNTKFFALQFINIPVKELRINYFISRSLR